MCRHWLVVRLSSRLLFRERLGGVQRGLQSGGDRLQAQRALGDFGEIHTANFELFGDCAVCIEVFLVVYTGRHKL